MCSEVWGAYAKNDFKKWDQTPIEKTHLKFCTLYLGVNKKASNFASRGELGKFPLLILMLKRTLNYINHLNQLPDKAIAKQAFLLSKALHTQGKESFYSNILKTINSYYDTNDKPITDLETKIENSGSIEIIKNIKDTYISFWKQEISNQPNYHSILLLKKTINLKTT